MKGYVPEFIHYSITCREYTAGYGFNPLPDIIKQYSSSSFIK